MMRNQCWASKPHVPISNRGLSSDKLIQKKSKQQIGDWQGKDTSPQTNVTTGVSMWVYISLFKNHVFRKRRTCFNAAQYLKNRGGKGGGTCLFCFSQLTSRCLPESLDLCMPLTKMVLIAVNFSFPLPGATAYLEHLFESSSGFHRERIHRVYVSLPYRGKPFSLMILFFFIT